MFKIASATIVAMTGVMADISADLAQSTTTIQAMNNQSGANDAMVARLNQKSAVFRARDSKMKGQIEADKQTIKALSVKFYAAKSDHDNL
jgi:thiamine kinase-like enzyme